MSSGLHAVSNFSDVYALRRTCQVYGQRMEVTVMESQCFLRCLHP